MTKVLFCVLPEKGHLNPCIGPAQRLVDAGLEVAFHAPFDLSATLAVAGLHFLGEHRPPPAADRREGALFASNVRDVTWLRNWIKQMLVDSVEDGIGLIERAIARFAPDILVLDPMLYAAAIAAHRAGIPWVTLSNSLNPVLPDRGRPGPRLDSELLRTVEWLAASREALFARHGMAPVFSGCDLISPHLSVAFTTPEFVGESDGRHPGVALVGPSLPGRSRGDETPFPWERLTGAPLVYMSLGSQIYHQPELFRRVIEAVRDRPVQLVLAAAGLCETADLGALPSNVLAVRYAPQLAILARARVFLTHGGANSVMEAMAHAVPLLLVPLCNDQFHQVWFVEKAGVGRALAAGEEPWPAIAALLEPGPVRERVTEVSASYQVDGAAAAARLIAGLASGVHPGRVS